MNLQFKVGYCITTQTLDIALNMKVGWNYRQETDRQTLGLLGAPGGLFRNPLNP